MEVAKESEQRGSGEISPPWSPREPYSPETMGRPLPYLDVITVHSKRLLPLSRKEFEAQRAMSVDPSQGPAVDEDNEEDDEGERATAATRDALDVPGKKIPVHADLDVEELLQSVRLLVEPLAMPSLGHTGVRWKHKSANGTPGGDKVAGTSQQATVVDPNTPVKLFYPTGAKNANMREFIKETIDKHMAGIHESDASLTSLHHSQSAPTIAPAAGSPDKVKSTKKPKTDRTAKAHGHSPAKASPSKRGNALGSGGIAAGARLSGSVSTSGLLNPDLTRQAREVIAQIRTNANKVHDLIGS